MEGLARLEHGCLALMAAKDPPRHCRYAVRWPLRLLEEHDGLTLEVTALAVVSALAALGGPSTEQAHSTLSAMAERATRAEVVGAALWPPPWRSAQDL